MSDPSLYTHPSPLAGYENLPPLPQEKHQDGPNAKALINPSGPQLSSAYTSFASPISNGTRGGFDIHVYYLHTSAQEMEYAKALHERIRREFPELRIYRLMEGPVGPHPVGMFEVNVFSPQQFGAFVAWLVVARGPLSVLIHPNTDDEVRDHTQLATWMGQPYPLQVGMLREMVKKKAEEEEAKKAGDGAGNVA